MVWMLETDNVWVAYRRKFVFSTKARLLVYGRNIPTSN